MRLLYVFLGIAFVVLRYMARRWWNLRRSRKRQQGNSLHRAGSSSLGQYAAHSHLPGLPQAHSPGRTEAAKEAEAEATAKQLSQQLPVGPQYLTRDELVEVVKPTDAQMALCSLYSNRCTHLPLAKFLLLCISAFQFKARMSFEDAVY